MDMQDRVAQAQRAIAFIATNYTETNESIAAALGVLVKDISDFSANLVAARAAAAEAHAAYLKRVEDNKAAVLAKDGKLPEPQTANIGLKV